jgi:hypothetical protein
VLVRAPPLSTHMYTDLAGWQSRADSHDEKGWIDITAQDVDAAADFAAAFVDRDAGKAFDLAHLYAFDSALVLLGRYGETGYGDKPTDMNRVAYWCAHVADERLAEAVERIKACPPEACVFAGVKPPSSAPKCHVCQAKIPRGELGIESRSVRGILTPLSWNASQMPVWKTQVRTRRCTAPACLEGLRLAGPIALVDVPDGKRAQAAALAEAVAKPAPEAAENEAGPAAKRARAA